MVSQFFALTLSRAITPVPFYPPKRKKEPLATPPFDVSLTSPENARGTKSASPSPGGQSLPRQHVDEVAS